MDFIPDPSLQKQVQPSSGFMPDTSLTFDQSKAALGHSQSVVDGFKPTLDANGQPLTGLAALKKNMGALGNDAVNTLPTAGAIVGGIGGAAGGALLGAETGPGAALTGYAGGVAGSGAGAAAGEALKEKIQGANLNVGEIAKQGGIYAGLEAIGGPVLSAGGKLLEGVSKPIMSAAGKGLSYLGEKFGAKPVADTLEKAVRPPVALATKRLASTADTMTRKELGQETSRVLPSGKVVPSATEKRAGEILAGKTYANPVKTLKSVKDEIATRGKEAETYLEKASTPISNKEDFQAFQSAKASSEKYMTPAETAAYDEQVGVFQKILKSYTGNGGYNTANYYKGLKDYESQVTANLPKGKDALLVPGGSARIQAAKDIRGVVRDMIGEKNPEFKSKMYDLASLYDAQDNVAGQVVEKAKQSTSFAKRHPVVTGAAKYGAEAIGAGALYEGAKEVGVPLP